MRDASNVPEALQPYVEYGTFGAGAGPHDGVDLTLTPAGIDYAKSSVGSGQLARWLTSDDRWRGGRSEKNLAGEISAHARFARWPLLARRANPVNIEYLQNWPVGLLFVVPNRIPAQLRR